MEFVKACNKSAGERVPVENLLSAVMFTTSHPEYHPTILHLVDTYCTANGIDVNTVYQDNVIQYLKLPEELQNALYQLIQAYRYET